MCLTCYSGIELVYHLFAVGIRRLSVRLDVLHPDVTTLLDERPAELRLCLLQRHAPHEMGIEMTRSSSDTFALATTAICFETAVDVFLSVDPPPRLWKSGPGPLPRSR